MTPVSKSASETLKQFAEPVCATVEGRIRDIRDNVEDCVAQTRIQIRRKPFVTVGAVAGAAVALGCVIGFVAGRRPPSE